MEPTVIIPVKKKVIRVKKTTVTTEAVTQVAATEEPVNVIVKIKKQRVQKETKEDKKSEEEKPTCGICLEPYNKIANTEVKCCFCDKSSCRRCIQTFLTTTTNDPHCMHCTKAWEREFIDDNLTMTYRMSDYKKHRENILLDREIALMPATQGRAEQVRSADKMEKEVIKSFDAQLIDLYAQQAKINVKISRIQRLRSDAQYQIRLLRTGQGEKVKSEVTFIRKCPDSECRGFLSTAWKCGLCSKWACPECHELKGENRDTEHICDPNNVATAKLLAKDSRPCPGCATVITKIEGCDQMWCPQCHTPFSWRTGQKETGVVHNPHFYEWQRKLNGGVAPRVAGDIACGGIPHYNELNTGLAGLTHTERGLIMTFHRVLNHIQHVELIRYHNVFNEADNEDLRVNYLLGYITQDSLKTDVQAREKRREKERAVRRALEVLVQAGTDLIRRIISENNVEKKRSIIDEIDALRVYVNELLTKIYNRMKLSVNLYKPTWDTYNPFTAAGQKREARLEAAKAARKANEERAALYGIQQQRREAAILPALVRPIIPAQV